MSKSKEKHFSISAANGREMRKWSPQCVKLAVTAYSLASDNYGQNYGYVCESYASLAKTAGISKTPSSKWARLIGLEYRNTIGTDPELFPSGIYLVNPEPCIGPPPRARSRQNRPGTFDTNTHYINNKKEELYSSKSNFEEVWRLYPRKVGKAKALSCYLKLEPEETLSLLAAVRKWGPKFPRDELQFCPHFTTYVNRRGWEDEEHPGQSKWGDTVVIPTILDPDYYRNRTDFDD